MLRLLVQVDAVRARPPDPVPDGVNTGLVISRTTSLDLAGVERETGVKVFAIGSLHERIPRCFRTERHAAWQWSRYRPGKVGTPGSRMDVEGMLLSESS